MIPRLAQPPTGGAKTPSGVTGGPVRNVSPATAAAAAGGGGGGRGSIRIDDDVRVRVGGPATFRGGRDGEAAVFAAPVTAVGGSADGGNGNGGRGDCVGEAFGIKKQGLEDSWSTSSEVCVCVCV